jgi:hypothetical protein
MWQNQLKDGSFKVIANTKKILQLLILPKQVDDTEVKMMV